MDFFELLKCLLCCADEADCHPSSSDYTDEERLFARSHYQTFSPSPSPSPRLSHFPISISTSTSFLPSFEKKPSFLPDRHCSHYFGGLRSPDAPPKLSYTPPLPQSTTPPTPITSFLTSSSTSKPRPILSSTIKPSSSFPKNPPQPTSQISKPNPSSPKPPPLSSSPSSPNLPFVYKSFLSSASSASSSKVIHQRQLEGKKTDICVEGDLLPAILIPEDNKSLKKKEIVPKVLNRPLSPKTYKDYFAALLYSEDLYLQKWGEFLLKGVTLELDESAIYKNGKKQEDKTCVAFELDPVERPYLLSGDSVFARQVGNSAANPFKGFIYIIIGNTRVLVEFEDGFYSDHNSSRTYDVSFSFNTFSKKKKRSIPFNRVFLERARHAVKAASEALFQNFLFPDCDSRASIPTAPPLLSTTCHKLDHDQRSAVGNILRIQGSPPYVVTGPDCVREPKSFVNLTRTGVVVSEAVHQLCQKSQEYRILICAPTNSCCDVLMRSMVKVIPELTMFRVNAAFRDKEELSEDILRSSLYKKKQSCFSCPPIEKLRTYRVIFSTFVSSFLLHDEGIAAGHFSHIFLVDASSAIEPETLVPLTNFADKTTSVIVTGKPGNSPRWVRAEIARKEGLKASYFERLCKLKLYRTASPMFITHLDLNQKSDSDYQTRVLVL